MELEAKLAEAEKEATAGGAFLYVAYCWQTKVYIYVYRAFEKDKKSR